MQRRAVGHLEEAISIHPRYKNAYLLLGNAHNYLKNYEQSIAYYQKALELDPDYEQARSNLGITYKDAGKYYGQERQELGKSIQYLRKAYEILPQEFEVARLLGVAHGMRGNTSKAVEYFTKATELSPENANAWFDLGTAYINAGQPALGQQYHQKAVKMDPSLAKRLGGN